MSKQTINIGASPNDGTGTPLRTSFDYTNQNFTELYTAVGPSGNNIVVPGNATITGAATVGTTLGVTGVSTLASAVITGDLTVDTSTLKVDSGANKVGIGTTTMNGVLTVKNPNVAVESSIYAIQAATSTSQLSSWTIDQNTDVVSFGTDYAGALSLKTNSVERCNISSAGNVNISTGNVVMATSGKGIDFSATASGSGTMTSELLNDYEEGTWVGTIGGTTTNPTTSVFSTGRYTKIGRQVSVEIGFYGDTTGASGRITVSGLPFTSNASISRPGIIAMDTMGTFTGSPVAYLAAGVTLVDLYASSSNGSLSNVTHNAGAGRALYMALTYNV